MNELWTALADNLIDTIKTMLAWRDQKIAALESSISASKGAIAILASIQPAQNGKDGKDGKDADPEVIKALVDDAIARIPRPLDGASVTLEEFLPLIAREVNEAVAKIHLPRDGKDADPEVIKALVDDAIARIPRPLDGASVTLEDVGPLIVREVNQAVSKIPAPQDGKDADPETIRRMVKDVCDAMPKPIYGSDGRDGLDGRDAFELEILASIDEGKSYPRGTYATHDGGLWRAYEKTTGRRGWECIVDGVSEISVEQQSNRSIVITAKKSSGTEIVKTMDLPVMIYSGVFIQGKSYSTGDVVTFGGSLFHCNRPTQGKPELGDDWTLCVKRGRDGKAA